MPLMDRRQITNAEQQQSGIDLLQTPDLASEDSPVEQLPFPNPVSNGLAPVPYNQLSAPPDTALAPVRPHPITSPGADGVLRETPDTSRALIDPSISPKRTRALPDANLTRQLIERQASLFPEPKTNTTSSREPLVIRGSGTKSPGLPRPPQGRRLVINAAVTALLLFIVLSTLLAVLPAGTDAHGGGLGLLDPITKFVNTKGNNSARIASQAATATAVTQDGYDPGAQAGTFIGVAPPPPNANANGNNFYYGQCTYWAATRYHQLTGIWVSWQGNANQWVGGAAQNGWVVSGIPKLHSVIVLQAFVQGAGYYGHVAIVEGINPDGSVTTSNWNWGGAWATTTYVTFYPGPGVNFVYAAGH